MRNDANFLISSSFLAFSLSLITLSRTNVAIPSNHFAKEATNSFLSSRMRCPLLGRVKKGIGVVKKDNVTFVELFSIALLIKEQIFLLYSKKSTGALRNSNESLSGVCTEN